MSHPTHGTDKTNTGARTPATLAYILTAPFLVLLRLIDRSTLAHKIGLCCILFGVGSALALSLAPIMTEMSNVVVEIEKERPGVFGKSRSHPWRAILPQHLSLLCCTLTQFRRQRRHGASLRPLQPVLRHRLPARPSLGWHADRARRLRQHDALPRPALLPQRHPLIPIHGRTVVEEAAVEPRQRRQRPQPRKAVEWKC